MTIPKFQEKKIINSFQNDVAKNGYRIRGYYDREIFVVNLGCCYSPYILFNTYLHGQERGWDKAIMSGSVGDIVILANWEKHFIWVCENLSQYPCILKDYMQHNYIRYTYFLS